MDSISLANITTASNIKLHAKVQYAKRSDKRDTLSAALFCSTATVRIWSVSMHHAYIVRILRVVVSLSPIFFYPNVIYI